MSNEYEILVIEDNEADAYLMNREIQRLIPNSKFSRIETPQQLDESLTRHWDMILCDFNLPEFDALTVLRLIREKEIDTPFILVSGLVEEGIAVSMMRLGANDYIMKDNLKRLGPAVLRELREAKIKSELKTEKLKSNIAGNIASNQPKPVVTKNSGLLDFIEAASVPSGQSEVIKERHKAVVNILYVAGLIKKHQNSILEQHNLTEPQLNLLLVLNRHYPDAITINSLKDEIVNKTSDISRLIDRMSKLDLINYSQNSEDKRARNVSISKKGQAVLDEMNYYANDMFLDEKALPESTAQVLNEQLKKMMDLMIE